MSILTRVLEDATGEYQFEIQVDEQNEINVLNQFYELWEKPKMRGRIIKEYGRRVAARTSIDIKPVCDDEVVFEAPRIFDFKMIKANR